MKLISLLFLSVVSLSQTQQLVTLDHLKQEAFLKCQSPFKKFKVTPIPELDPPRNGTLEEPGLVYQEELSIKTDLFLDQNKFYMLAKPRAALNQLPMDIFISKDQMGRYEQKSWEDANVDYSSENIRPPILKDSIPSEGKVLTELIIGHESPQGDYPQLFDFRSSGYVRFAGYPPQITGASLRVAAHRIFGEALKENSLPEDFPVIRSIYASVKSEQLAHVYLIVESELFCGALSVDLIEGQNAEMIVDGFWYTREDFKWKNSPHTAFVAYSSMLWKTERHTPCSGRLSATLHGQ